MAEPQQEAPSAPAAPAAPAPDAQQQAAAAPAPAPDLTARAPADGALIDGGQPQAQAEEKAPQGEAKPKRPRGKRKTPSSEELASSLAATRPKRERKEVHRFAPPSPTQAKAEVEIRQGAGIALGDIENVEETLRRSSKKAKWLKALHRTLYPGAAVREREIRDHIRAFSGFPADSMDDCVEKARQHLGRLHKSDLHEVLLLLDLPLSGNKDEQIEAIVDFLRCPKSSGGHVRAKSKRTKKGGGGGRVTPYFAFCGEHRAALAAQHPGIRVTEISKMLGEQWRNLSDEDKQKYADKAREESASSKRRRTESEGEDGEATSEEDDGVAPDDRIEYESSDDDQPILKEDSESDEEGKAMEKRLLEILEKSDLTKLRRAEVFDKLKEEYGSKAFKRKKEWLKQLTQQYVTNVSSKAMGQVAIASNGDGEPSQQQQPEPAQEQAPQQQPEQPQAAVAEVKEPVAVQ